MLPLWPQPRSRRRVEPRSAVVSMKYWYLVIVAGAAAAAAFLPVAASVAQTAPAKGSSMDWSDWSPKPPDAKVRLLFIHHSCGGQWLGTAGPEFGDGAACIFRSHPNGGDLRDQLQRNGYEVHEASYGSEIGKDTDIFDWLPKFQSSMDTVLRIDEQDRLLAPSWKNEVVVFKSCYPNNDFISEGSPPGSARGPELTVWNARATFSALLPLFERHPEVLFLYVTAPPLAPRIAPSPAWKVVARKLLRQPDPATVRAEHARLARMFQNWMTSPDGWLKSYSGKNVAVFDYYGILTAGQSNLSVYSTHEGYDSHPSAAGNQEASRAFVPLLNRAVRRAGIGAPDCRATGEEAR